MVVLKKGVEVKIWWDAIILNGALKMGVTKGILLF